MFEEYAKHDVAVYGGYVCDDEKLLQCTSGGIATALSEYMLSLGGYVAGVAYSEDFYKAEYVVTNDPADIERFKGSKYVDCDKKGVYARVKELLEAGEKVLFVGLPCTVGALYKTLGGRPENLVTCELICHGPTMPKVHSDYVKYLEKKYGSKVVDFSVRRKKDAWEPGYLYARFENGKVFLRDFYQTEYGYAFAVLGRESCYGCKFRGNNRQGDLMLGDFWGATQEDAYWNKRGVSVIFVETEKGDAFLKAAPGIKLFPAAFEKAVAGNPMVIRPRKESRYKKQFAKLLEEKGLFYAAHHAAGLKTKVKWMLLKLLKK